MADHTRWGDYKAKREATYIMDTEESAYARWKNGRCPCCGITDLVDTPLDVSAPVEIAPAEPKWIGEGVKICGYCVPHMTSEVENLVLKAIALGAQEAK
jgi:hypothetical protein